MWNSWHNHESPIGQLTMLKTSWLLMLLTGSLASHDHSSSGCEEALPDFSLPENVGLSWCCGSPGNGYVTSMGLGQGGFRIVREELIVLRCDMGRYHVHKQDIRNTYISSLCQYFWQRIAFINHLWLILPILGLDTLCTATETSWINYTDL